MKSVIAGKCPGALVISRTMRNDHTVVQARFGTSKVRTDLGARIFWVWPSHNRGHPTNKVARTTPAIPQPPSPK